MYRILLAASLLAASSLSSTAQTWAPWHQPSLLGKYGPGGRAARKAAARPAPVVAPRPSASQRRGAASRNAARSAPLAPVTGNVAVNPDGTPAVVAVRSGGPRPNVSPRGPKSVRVSLGHAKGTIVIDSAARRLYLVQSSKHALSYPVSVGREGFAWNGTEKISRVASWPDWHPPAEMRERIPTLPLKMTGGLYNPLGAKALYLGNTLYRIHGTSDAKSIGQAASSGCFRMHNRHVVDLANRVGIGTKVVVVNAPPAPTASANTARQQTTTQR